MATFEDRTTEDIQSIKTPKPSQIIQQEINIVERKMASLTDIRATLYKIRDELEQLEK